jgi:ABC-2 type transport system permease protein
MARLLVQLKLRLLGNALHASTPAKVSFIISITCAVIVAAGTFTVLALLRGQPASVDVTTVIFTTFALGWLILPIFVFGLDGTLDPATLALYPLRTPRWPWGCWPPRPPGPGRWPTCSACSA